MKYTTMLFGKGTKGSEMFITEKVSPSHPDKIADRIAGALVDYCYSQSPNPKCAFEVLIGHGFCFITAETSVKVPEQFVLETVDRITGDTKLQIRYVEAEQDQHLAKNQEGQMRCGDNGVFAGFPMPKTHIKANTICQKLYKEHPFDGKIVLNDDTNELTVCWSNTTNEQIKTICPEATNINPLGEWTGGVDVDTGLTGRKLASDFYGIEFPLGGGNMHGKDLSKADCSVNIYCFCMAQRNKKPYKAICSIGDTTVNVNGQRILFDDIVTVAELYVQAIGGFEKLAEWGLI